MPLILGTLGAKEADFCAFKASLVYMVSFRTAEDMQRDLVSTNKNDFSTSQNQWSVTRGRAISW